MGMELDDVSFSAQFQPCGPQRESMQHTHTLFRFVTWQIGGFVGHGSLKSECVLHEYTLYVNQGASPLTENQMVECGQRKARVILVGRQLRLPPIFLCRFHGLTLDQTVATAPSGWSS